MFNVHNSIKNLTRVISSIELDQIMNSPGSIDDFSYIGLLFFKNLLFPWQNGDKNSFFSSTFFAANACIYIEKCRFCIDFDGF